MKSHWRHALQFLAEKNFVGSAVMPTVLKLEKHLSLIRQKKVYIVYFNELQIVTSKTKIFIFDPQIKKAIEI